MGFSTSPFFRLVHYLGFASRSLLRRSPRPAAFTARVEPQVLDRPPVVGEGDVQHPVRRLQDRRIGQLPVEPVA